jgi:anti-anti-sigma factor
MFTTLSPVTALNQPHSDTTRPAPATVRVAVVGEIDLATAPVLRDRLLTVLREQTPAVLVVDLAGVTFLDCAGLGVLVDASNAAVHAGRRMRVSHPQPTVRRILDMAGLLGVLTAPTDRSLPAATRPPALMAAA